MIISQLLLDEEKVRAIGVSNFNTADLDILMSDPELSVNPHVNQCEFHPYHNPKEIRQFCTENHIQFQVRSFLYLITLIVEICF